MTSNLQLVSTRPAPVNGEMGHVKNTAYTVMLERKYDAMIIGYTAKWRVINGEYRVQVWDESMNQWRGTYSMSKDDLEIYTKRETA